MRVIAGALGGQNFESPHGHRTHPMSEKIRGAIFGVLGDIKGLSVLDAFAGSGAVAIEAISRGATSALAIEVDQRAYDSIKRNINTLNISEKMEVVKAYFNAWSTRHQTQLFDIIIADPPYDDVPYRDLKVLSRHLMPDGIIVLSWPAKADEYYIPGFEVVQSKKYGDAQLLFYKHD